MDEPYLFDGDLTSAQIQRLIQENQPPLASEIVPTAHFQPAVQWGRRKPMPGKRPNENTE